MADLTATAAQVAVVNHADAEIRPIRLGATVTAGQSLYIDASNNGDLADANAAGLQQTRALALEGGVSGSVVNALVKGEVYGFDLSAQAYDAPIFQSDTAGALADAAGTLAVPVGVVRGLTDASATKVLYFNARERGDYV